MGCLVCLPISAFILALKKATGSLTRLRNTLTLILGVLLVKQTTVVLIQSHRAPLGRGGFWGWSEGLGLSLVPHWGMKDPVMGWALGKGTGACEL